MAALIYLDHLCKNNRLISIVGCILIYDNYTCFRPKTTMAFSMGILSIILVGLNKLYYLASTMYMYLHKYLLKHIYYYQSCHWHYIKHRQQYNVHVETPVIIQNGYMKCIMETMCGIPRV